MIECCKCHYAASTMEHVFFTSCKAKALLGTRRPIMSCFLHGLELVAALNHSIVFY